MNRISAARRGVTSGTDQGTGTRRRIIGPNDKPAPLVLLVEDRDDDRELYATFLAHAGIRVEEAVDGEHAIWKVVALMPDIVVMDVAMPVLSGIDATKQIKAHPKTQHIAVIALTAFSTAEVRERATKAGADAFLTKPCDPDTLLQTIRHILERRSGAG